MPCHLIFIFSIFWNIVTNNIYFGRGNINGTFEGIFELHIILIIVAFWKCEARAPRTVIIIGAKIPTPQSAQEGKGQPLHYSCAFLTRCWLGLFRIFIMRSNGCPLSFWSKSFNFSLELKWRNVHARSRSFTQEF